MLYYFVKFHFCSNVTFIGNFVREQIISVLSSFLVYDEKDNDSFPCHCVNFWSSQDKNEMSSFTIPCCLENHCHYTSSILVAKKISRVASCWYTFNNASQIKWGCFVLLLYLYKMLIDFFYPEFIHFMTFYK